MRTLLVDNYDSYTYNLLQLIAAVNGTEPVVVLNDASEWVDIDLAEFDNIVISPGPGHPGRSRDFGRCTEVLAQARIPTLGVCLGHQGIGLVAGAEVLRAPRARHGHLSPIRHDGSELFTGIPQGFTAVRYHSLCLREPLPDGLRATAWSEDGVIMAVRHERRRQWGVQFHPESVATEWGHRLLANFAAQTRAAKRRFARGRPAAGVRPATREWTIEYRKLAGAVDTELAFAALYADSPRAFWLDSSMVAPGLSRFSFMGDACGPHAETLTYRMAEGEVRVQPGHGDAYQEAGTIFDVLGRRLLANRLESSELSCGLIGGYVGFFGYELKAECGGSSRFVAETPDAMWMFADRLVVVDHVGDITYLVALCPRGAPRGPARAWLERTEAVLERLPELDHRPPDGTGADPDGLREFLVRDEDRYLAQVAECRRLLAEGESYEICLTNALRMAPPDDVLGFYLRMRRANPAPYAALLRHDGLSIASSSPERFLRIEPDGRVESRPIKGTAPRHEDPDADAEARRELGACAKTQAENLMIVDLLRNDLGRVCQVGSIEVPRFMDVESYATVHHLVSTIRGRLRPEVSPVACVQACFPGGSMTGAPKVRTMEIIDTLEEAARGVYSGALGYFGLDGTTDLSIVIRTAVITPEVMSIGAGGAVVLDSEPQAEFDEMMLKAAAPLHAPGAIAVAAGA